MSAKGAPGVEAIFKPTLGFGSFETTDPSRARLIHDFLQTRRQTHDRYHIMLHNSYGDSKLFASLRIPGTHRP